MDLGTILVLALIFLIILAPTISYYLEILNKIIRSMNDRRK